MKVVMNRWASKATYLMVALALCSGPGRSTRQAAADAPGGYFTVQGSEVIDSRTGLTWQRTSATGTFMHQQALDACAALGNNYRLPTVLELYSLVDITKASGAHIDATAFPDETGDLYWTSTRELGDFSAVVWFIDGGIYSSTSDQQLRVRCVR